METSTSPHPQAFSPLRTALEGRPGLDADRIRRAFEVADIAHAPQRRESGEPYIVHPVAVARILVELGMDEETVIAAILHDVLEDCPEIAATDIERDFGPDVLALIEGVTKLKLPMSAEGDEVGRAVAETARKAETLRKMLLAMAKDFRVMVIKLGDRLHNMMTLDAMPERKKIRIASETLDIYAPLAARLGIWQLKWQLEDLSFKALHPAEFAQVSELVGKTRRQREGMLEGVIAELRTKFEERNVRIADLRGRPKHLFSIFTKMVKGKVPFDEIYDLLALRIIVDTIPDCYVALGIVHETYVQIPTLFFDYIARPKPNGYQSLHTKVVGPNGQPLEVQIRTRGMHAVAEHGVAAHWTYKEGRTDGDEVKSLGKLRQQLQDLSHDSETSSDFLRTVSTDFFSEQVFVFTPKGDVIDLPTNSTPVDFAFRVHSQLGLKLVGAKINGVMTPLSGRLSNGDVVELVTRGNAQPSWDWLEFVQSAHTKQKLRNHFRKLSKGEDALRGRGSLEKELERVGLTPREWLGEDKLQKVADTMVDCENPTDVLAKLGNGLVGVQAVVDKLRGLAPEIKSLDRIVVSKTREGKLSLDSGVMISRAKCCQPIPGDEVVGYTTRGRGIMIHRRVCPNAVAYTANPDDAARLTGYEWPPDGNVYTVPLKIMCLNRSGLLMDITHVFGTSNTNVSSATVKTTAGGTADIEVILDVSDTTHLARITDRVMAYGDVISVQRQIGKTGR